MAGLKMKYIFAGRSSKSTFRTSALMSPFRHLAIYPRSSRISTSAIYATSAKERRLANGPEDRRKEEVLPSRHFDVVIVGGGIVGASLACKLALLSATSSLKIALIESSRPLALSEVRKISIPDPRVYAITPGSQAFLDTLGVWSMIQDVSAPFHNMQVWDSTGNGFVRFQAPQLLDGTLGHIVEHRILQSSLFERLGSIPKSRIEVLTSSSVRNLKLNAERGTLVELDDGSSIEARLVVGADGAQSRVKALSGLYSASLDYGQHAVVGTVATDRDNRTAWQRFLPGGPVALLPLTSNRSSIVWSTTPQESRELCKISERDFVDRLNDALQTPLRVPVTKMIPPTPLLNFPVPWLSAGAEMLATLANLATKPGSAGDQFQVPPLAVGVIGDRLTFPLKIAHAINYVKPRVALIGDAAHSIHPMAGQGLNLGLGDSSSLASILNKSVMEGQDIGSAIVLEQYEESRKLKNLSMQVGVDIIKRLFTDNATIDLQVERTLGLGLMNNSLSAKVLALACASVAKLY